MEILKQLAGWNWGQIFQTIATIITAGIAYMALGTWRSQLKERIRTDFLDDLSDAAHELTDALNKPLTMVQLANTAIRGYEGLPGVAAETPNAAAIAFIKRDGKLYSDRISEYLEGSRAPLARLSSLVEKGKAIGFERYELCINSGALLSWRHQQIEAYGAIIGSQNLNWEHPEVQRTLSKVLTVDYDEMYKGIEKCKEDLQAFFAVSYGKIFNDT